MKHEPASRQSLAAFPIIWNTLLPREYVVFQYITL